MADQKAMEAKLREHEELVRALSENVTDFIRIHDLQGRCVYGSNSVARLYGRQPTALFESVHPDDLAACQRWWQQAVAGVSRRIEWRVREASGEWRWLETLASRIEYLGQPHLLTVCRDVTGRQQVAAASKESEDRFGTLVTFSPDAIYLHCDGRITLVNPAMCALLGAAEPAQLIGKSVFEIVHPDFHALVRARWQQIFTGEPAPTIEEKFIRLDGIAVDVEVNAVQVEFNGRKEIQVIARDITGRKQAEQHIRYLNRVYAMLSGINQTIVREKDLAKVFELACRIAVEKGGFRMAWIGMLDSGTSHIRLAASAGAAGDTLELLRAILSNDQPGCDCAFTNQALQGSGHGVCNDIEHDPLTIKWREFALQKNYRAMASLALKKDGKTAGTFNLYAGERDFFDTEELHLLDELTMDISFALEVHQQEVQRRAIEEELIWKTALLEAQVHSALDGILVVDSRKKIILRNQRFEQLWNAPKDIGTGGDDVPLLQFAINQTKHPAQFAGKVAYLYDHPDEISRDEIELVDGRVFDRYSAPVRNTTGKHFGRIWTFRDITREKQAETALRLSEAQLRATFEGAAIGIALVNLEGRPIKCNLALTRILGYSQMELSHLTFAGFTHPQDVEVDMQLYRSLLAGERDQYEIEKRYIRKDGQIVWGRLTVSLVKQADGNPPLAIGMVEDITARRKLEEQFRQSQKMEAFGQLAGGVAHDFNNILAVIQLQAALLGAGERLSPAQSEVADEIVRAADRAANLTRQLLLFSRKQTLRPINLNLNEVVSHTTKMLERILGEDVSLNTNFAPNLPAILADTGMIEQVLLNLAVNSRDAMPNGGNLLITTRTESLNAIPTEPDSQVAPGLYVCLTVADNGSGIPPEILPHIFEPFFTTKEAGRGTGLGLATVYGIVQQHHGWINVTSEIGRGTTFHIYFPAVLGSVAENRMDFTTAQLPQGTETLLLVEDESALLTSVSNTLLHCGYKVLRAGSGLEALRVWQKHKEQIQLLLTDIVMPDGMTGFELSRQLRAEKPQLNVVYMSGYIDDLAGKRANLVEGFDFLQKPFVAKTLAETLRKNLDQK
ncbi:MAG TPA: PAS domain S-box protein [Verrucomicrobiae bacterium]